MAGYQWLYKKETSKGTVVLKALTRVPYIVRQKPFRVIWYQFTRNGADLLRHFIGLYKVRKRYIVRTLLI